MNTKAFILYTGLLFLWCNNHVTSPDNFRNVTPQTFNNSYTEINPYTSIHEIPLPAGFMRIKASRYSFAEWLQHVKLKKDKIVYKFDGCPKKNQSAQFAVLDVSVGDKNLQKCADAVMRLRAEYLFAIKKYQDIRFSDNNGKVYQLYEPYTSKNLQHYLQRVFAICGSASLSKQLTAILFKDIEPGDVIVRGGFPGHAIMVMDVAVNRHGKKIYLVAQSYMPAQDIHVLVNPINKLMSPWYEVNEDELIQTPEYCFNRKELKRW
ncbi:MAG: DUF4846 domain-containing protein [Ferruginibacter sp.]